MTADQMREILRQRYGIKNDEEFWEACKKSKGIDVSIFTMPVKKEEQTA